MYRENTLSHHVQVGLLSVSALLLCAGRPVFSKNATLEEVISQSDFVAIVNKSTSPSLEAPPEFSVRFDVIEVLFPHLEQTTVRPGDEIRVMLANYSMLIADLEAREQGLGGLSYAAGARYVSEIPDEGDGSRIIFCKDRGSSDLPAPFELTVWGATESLEEKDRVLQLIKKKMAGGLPATEDIPKSGGAQVNSE